MAVVLPRRRRTAAEVNRTWQAFLRRFDIEHTFRFLKQVLGWTRPKLRDPAAADRWTWLVIACYAQLYLARAPRRRHPAALAAALPARPADPRPGPPRVPQHPPGTARSGQRAETRQTRPRRPPGSKNRRPATRHDVGKTVKRDEPKKKTRRQKG